MTGHPDITPHRIQHKLQRGLQKNYNSCLAKDKVRQGMKSCIVIAHLEHRHVHYKAIFREKSRRTNSCVKDTLIIVNSSFSLIIHHHVHIRCQVHTKDIPPNKPHSHNMPNPDINHPTETKEPNKDLKIKHLRQKSEKQHTSHWDQMHYTQYIKLLIQVFWYYFIYHLYNLSIYRHYSHIVCNTKRQTLDANSRLILYKYKTDPIHIPPHTKMKDTAPILQPSAGDPTQHELPPLRPGETWVYLSMITANKIPGLISPIPLLLQKQTYVQLFFH